jgi:hypothetical protein
MTGLSFMSLSPHVSFRAWEICGLRLHVRFKEVTNNLDYSLMTYKFADNREKYLGMGESAAGLG